MFCTTVATFYLYDWKNFSDLIKQLGPIFMCFAFIVKIWIYVQIGFGVEIQLIALDYHQY